MRPIVISRYNNIAGTPADWNEERDGPCSSLYIRAEKLPGGLPRATTAWLPTSAEIAAMKRGIPILLDVIGTKSHPVVSLRMGSRTDLRHEEALKPLNDAIDAIIEGGKKPS